MHVAWDYGDGTYEAGGPAPGGRYVHAYWKPGVYSITLYVIDNEGGLDSVRRTIRVNDTWSSSRQKED